MQGCACHPRQEAACMIGGLGDLWDWGEHLEGVPWRESIIVGSFVVTHGSRGPHGGGLL